MTARRSFCWMAASSVGTNSAWAPPSDARSAASAPPPDPHSRSIASDLITVRHTCRGGGRRGIREGSER
eukprot:1746265-Pyramimonas_sp.AAC.1